MLSTAEQPQLKVLLRLLQIALAFTSDHEFNFESILSDGVVGHTNVQATVGGGDVSQEERTVHLHHSTCLVDAICRSDGLAGAVGVHFIATGAGAIADAKGWHVKATESFGCG